MNCNHEFRGCGPGDEVCSREGLVCGLRCPCNPRTLDRGLWVREALMFASLSLTNHLWSLAHVCLFWQDQRMSWFTIFLITNKSSSHRSFMLGLGPSITIHKISRKKIAPDADNWVPLIKSGRKMRWQIGECLWKVPLSSLFLWFCRLLCGVGGLWAVSRVVHVCVVRDGSDAPVDLVSGSREQWNAPLSR